MDLSVVMAVYNQAETLPQAARSILEQSFSDFQFIVVDDHSTDETVLILRRLAKNDRRIKVISNSSHLGLTKSLNLGWRSAKTRFIARMDADDIALPKRLKKQREYLLNHPKIALLGTGAYLVNEDGQRAGVKLLPQSGEKIRRIILSYCPFIHPTWMLPKNILAEFDGYDESFPYAQDYELALRIVSRHPTANLPEPLVYYRVNSPGAISLKRLKQQEILALKARWWAITKHGYSWAESWRLIKPLLSFGVPAGIKKVVYEKIFWVDRGGRRHNFTD